MVHIHHTVKNYLTPLTSQAPHGVCSSDTPRMAKLRAAILSTVWEVAPGHASSRTSRIPNSCPLADNGPTGSINLPVRCSTMRSGGPFGPIAHLSHHWYKATNTGNSSSP